MSFKEKYIKYRIKYLNLKAEQSLIQNQTGSGFGTAKTLFMTKVTRNYDDIITKLVRDRNLGILRFDGVPAAITDVTRDTPIFTNIFDQINEFIKETKNSARVNNSQIDWIIRSYINNTFGNPSSLGNYGKYEAAYNIYKILYSNREDGIYIRPFNEINGLIELEEYITTCQDLLREIQIKKEKAEREIEYQREIKLKGEEHVRIELRTQKLTIYVPLNEAGSKYYGRNTKWCTAARDNCLFDFYSRKGNLYIIQSNSNPIDKYQIHINENMLMNNEDDPIFIDYLLNHFKDEELNRWFDNIAKKLYKDFIDNIRQYGRSAVINSFNIQLNKDIVKKCIKESNSTSLFFQNFNIQIGDFLYDMDQITYINFGHSFDQQLNDSLKNLINLEQLEFGLYFNQSLDNSLDGLKNLKRLEFGEYYNQPLNNSLDKLTNLEELTFKDEFDQPLKGSLNKLVNLKTLTFGKSFNQSLGSSLRKLNNLITLTFGESFNNCEQPLSNSLDKLTRLKNLNIEGYTQRFRYSLDNLINLRNLKISKSILTKDKSKLYLIFNDIVIERLCSLNNKWIKDATYSN
jgi:hypothetical protein